MSSYKVNVRNEYIKDKSGIWYLASEILKQYNNKRNARFTL